jgi:hypothetical protein
MENLIYDRAVNMPCYLTTKEDMAQAEEEFQQRFIHGNILNKSTVYDRKESRLAGILGEIVFRKIYNISTIPEDLTIDYELGNLKIDVKCKLRKVRPKLDFEASFFAYQSTENYKSNMYYFMSTIMPMEKVWLCGFDTKENIMNHPKKVLWKAGQIDTSNRMEFKKDTICIPYKYLQQVDIQNIKIA